MNHDSFGKRNIKAHGKEIIITPFDEKRINPNSYNLSLADELLVYEQDELDMKKPNPTKQIVIPEEGLLLEPNRLYLGRTNEFTKTDRYVPMLEGRSSTGRLGLFIHGDRGLWRYRLRRVLDAGDFLCAAGQNISECGDLPDLLPRY